MLIVGAGGLAAQIFPDLVSMHLPDVVFWSETDTKYSFIKEKYRIINNDEDVLEYFNTISRTFILCVGGKHRKAMSDKFQNLGGRISTFISPFASVSPYCTIGAGSTILSHVILESGVEIGEGCLFNKTSNAGHACIISSYCEFAPGVMLMGDVEMGENCFVGPGAILLPRIKIGKNAVIAAGAVVKKDVPDNALVSGSFASVLKVYKEK